MTNTRMCFGAELGLVVGMFTDDLYKMSMMISCTIKCKKYKRDITKLNFKSESALSAFIHFAENNNTFPGNVTLL